MSKSYFVRFIPLIFLFGFSVAHADASEALEYTYYEVSIAPHQSLLAAINSRSPIRQNAQVFHGYTRWNIRWNFQWQEKSGLCSVTAVKLELKGEITLPKLVSANSAQQNEFQKYFSALKQHELGHYEIGKAAAYAIDQQLRNLAAMRSCSQLKQAANESAYQTIEKYRQQELKYDKDTEHGKTQGAWLQR